MRIGFYRIAMFPLFGMLSLAFGPVHPAWAQSAGGALAIGSSLGVSYIKPESGEGLTLITIPNGSNFVVASPGFRAAHVSAGRGFEFGMDLGLLYGNDGSSSVHDIIVGLDVAGFGSPQNATSPYYGAEAGLRDVDFFGQGNQPYFGAMLGVRHVVGTDNGAVKIGLRFRHYLENRSDGLVALNAFGLGMEFDLWIPR